jgi:hypothetical protein
VNNTAVNKGGAVMWTNKNFTQGADQNSFINNKAIYGDLFSSYPAKLDLKLENSDNAKKSDLFTNFVENLAKDGDPGRLL